MVILEECCCCVGLQRGTLWIGIVYALSAVLNLLNRAFSPIDTPTHNAVTVMYAVVCGVIAFLILYGTWDYSDSLLREAAVMMWVSGVMFWITYVVEIASYMDEEQGEMKEMNSSVAKTAMFLVSVFCSFTTYIAIHVYFPLVVWSYGHLYNDP